MARKVGVDWAPADTAAALHAQYRAEPVAEVRTRLHALWLLRRGEGPTAVAAVVGVGRNAVQRWLRWYREGGLEVVQMGWKYTYVAIAIDPLTCRLWWA